MKRITAIKNTGNFIKRFNKSRIFHTVTAGEWRDDFFKLECDHGDFLSYDVDGNLLTAVQSNGVFHCRFADTSFRATYDDSDKIYLIKE